MIRNKLFLLLIITFLITGSSLGQKTYCDDLLINQSYSIDREVHELEKTGNYYYSVNSGVRKKIDTSYISPTEKENQIKIPEINLTKGLNKLKIFYNHSVLDTFDLIYCPPDVSVSGLENLEKVKNTYIIKSNNEIQLSIKANSNCVCEVTARNGLAGLSYYLNGDSVSFLDQNQPQNGYTIKLNNIKPGHNSLKLNLIGITDQDLPDTYEEITEKNYRFFYIHFNPPDFVWKQDTLMKLDGYPSGGWFTGNGIVENSNYFNPNDANLGTNTITYHYPVNGEIVSMNKEIDVKAYDFSLEGDLTACRNSRGQYKIVNYDDENFTYDWEVENGGIQIATGVVNEIIAGNQKEYIKWNTGHEVDGNFGYIRVTATHKITGKQFTENIKTYIKESEAKGIPNLFFGDTENRLVICDNSDAAKYIWIKDDEPEITTDYNYIYFDSPGTEFRLILETLEGCRTEGFLSVNENSVNAVNKSMQNPISQNLTNKGFSIYPNPAQNKLNLLLKEPEGAKTIQIYNSISQVMFETALKEGRIHKEISVSEYPPGQYIIKITQGDSFVTGQFIKTN